MKIFDQLTNNYKICVKLLLMGSDVIKIIRLNHNLSDK